MYCPPFLSESFTTALPVSLSVVRACSSTVASDPWRTGLASQGSPAKTGSAVGAWRRSTKSFTAWAPAGLPSGVVAATSTSTPSSDSVSSRAGLTARASPSVASTAACEARTFSPSSSAANRSGAPACKPAVSKVTATLPAVSVVAVNCLPSGRA